MAAASAESSLGKLVSNYGTNQHIMQPHCYQPDAHIKTINNFSIPISCTAETTTPFCIVIYSTNISFAAIPALPNDNVNYNMLMNIPDYESTKWVN
jgi:hypothetical protein